ncbi:MAG: hypothetical protein AAF512_15565, partial [Pseudomonadota bacterium]
MFSFIIFNKKAIYQTALVSIICSVVLVSHSVEANTTATLETQRKQFKDARKFLGRRYITRFKKLSESLKDYP